MWGGSHHPGKQKHSDNTHGDKESLSSEKNQTKLLREEMQEDAYATPAEMDYRGLSQEVWNPLTDQSYCLNVLCVNKQKT